MGTAFALLSAFSYSIMYFMVRAGVRRGDLDGGAFVTTTVNVIVLTGFVALTSLAGDPPDWNLTGVAWFCLAGLLGTGFGRILLLGGMHRMGPVRAVSIVNTAPVLTIGVAVFGLGEELSNLAILATLLVAVGLGLLGVDAFATPDPAMRREPSQGSLRPDGAGDGRSLSPALAGLGMSSVSALGFGLSRVARRVGLTWMPDPLVGAMIGSATALLSNVAMQGARGRLRTVVVDSIRDPRPMLWLAGVCSTLGILFFFLALEHAPLAHVAVVSASETVMTLLISWLLFRRREVLSVRVVVAAIAVFGAGVLIALA